MYRGKYVVRGEEVYCTFGSILQQLKMPADHGCFSKGKPLMHKLDCVVGENIPSFGTCGFTGLPCVPQPANEWVNPHPRSYIDGERALMTTSILLCFTGPPGIIKFLNNGQAAMVDASKYGRIEPVDENGTIKVVIKGEQSYHSQHRKFEPGEYVFIDGVYYIDETKLEALKGEVKRKDKQLKNNAMIGVGVSNIVGGTYKVGAKAIKVGNAVIRRGRSASTTADNAVVASDHLGSTANASTFDTATTGAKWKTVSSDSAENTNKSFPRGYSPPYKPGTSTTVIELTHQTEVGDFVRVYDNINSPQAGSWVMNADDIKGLTPKEIQVKFALPTTPTHVTDVIFDPGTQLRTGTANKSFGYDGGGAQFDLMGQRAGQFINGRELP